MKLWVTELQFCC